LLRTHVVSEALGSKKKIDKPQVRMPTIPDSLSGKISRAQGCLLGQLAGDALGSLVEFQSADEIRRTYPNSVRELADGGTWNTIAGQPTDDSEMARMLVEQRKYDADQARQAYSFWLNSGPFDCGSTDYSSELTIRKRWAIGTSNTTVFSPFPGTSDHFGDATRSGW
jgi:ADP-ribosylglycohydrolase